MESSATLKNLFERSPTMKRLAAAFLLLLPLLSGSVGAQDSAPLPVPPDLTTFFAPDVAVINVEINFLTLPDDQARTIQVLDQAKRVWQTFNYPPQVKRINHMNVEDGLVLLDVIEPDTTSAQLWTLDPSTGEFKRYKNACLDWDRDSQIYYLNLTLKPHWEFYNDAKLGRMSLCNTGTEKSEFLLPKGGYWHNLNENLDGKWLLMWNTNRPDLSSFSDLHVYSYNVATRRLIYLGSFQFGEENHLRWISDTEGLYYSGGMPESFPRMLFYFDMTKPDSLTYFMDGWANYHDDPPRYEYLQTYHQVSHRLDMTGYSPCVVVLFNFSQKERTPQSHYLGEDCFGNVVRHQSSYFYVSYGESEPTKLTLYSLDTETKEQKTWFSDKDLLALDSTSPDGRYAILMLNDGTWPAIQDPTSGNTIPLEDLDPWIYSYYGLGSLHMAIFDTQQGKIVYDNPAWEDYGATNWVNDTSFIATDSERQHPVHLFQLTEKGLVQAETELPKQGSARFSPNNQLAIIKHDSQFVVYNLLTGKMTPLMNEFQSNDFDLDMKWTDNQRIQISLYHIHRYQYEKPIVYTISFPKH
jgi:hypothetical protein